MIVIAASMLAAVPALGQVVSVETVQPLEVRTFQPIKVEPREDDPLPDPKWQPPDHSPVEAYRDEAELPGGPVAPPDSFVPVLDEPQNAVTATWSGLSYESLYPPDTTLGKSSQRVIQAVNTKLALFDTAGTLLQSKSLAAFLGVTASPEAPFDPRVVYDRLGPNQRFFVLASHRKFNAQSEPESSAMYLAVSRSPNPANLDPASWCVYWIPTTSDGVTIHLTWADYPMLGVGADTLTISANYRTFVGGFRTYTILQAWDKPLLTNNAAGCQTGIATVFRPATTGADNSIFVLQPALHYTAPSSFPGTTNPVYLVSSTWRSGNTYRFWRLRNILGGASPSNLQVVTVSVADYLDPPNASQPGVPGLLEVQDPRIQQVAGLGNVLWFTHSLSCDIAGGAPESCIRVVRAAVGQDPQGNPTVTLTHQTTFGGNAGDFYFMPGIAVNNAERTVVTFLRSSSSQYLSSAWTAKSFSATTYPAASTLASGSCPRVTGQGNPATAIRTGDYVGLQTDPGLTSFVLGAEHAVVEPPGGGACTWRTTIRDLQ